MRNVKSETTSIIKYNPGTLQSDHEVGSIMVHDFQSTTGVQQINTPEHSLFLLRSDVTVSDVWQGMRQRQHTYAAGDVIFLPAGTEVRAPYVSNEYSETMIRFPETACTAIYGVIPKGSIDLHYRSICGDDTLGLLPAIRNIATRFDGPASLMPMIAESATMILVASIASKLCIKAERILTNLQDGMTDRRMARVLDFIEINLASQFTLQDMADVAALSTYHFSRSFKKRMGMTPVRYVWNRRIVRARILLRSPTMPIAHVAADCGFTNQAHFTTAFRLATGVTPAAFRRSHI